MGFLFPHLGLIIGSVKLKFNFVLCNQYIFVSHKNFNLLNNWFKKNLKTLIDIYSRLITN